MELLTADAVDQRQLETYFQLIVGGWGDPDSLASCCIFEAANNYLLVVSHCHFGL